MDAIFTDEIVKQLREGKFKYLVADIFGDKKVYKFDMNTDEFVCSISPGSAEGLRAVSDAVLTETIKRGSGLDDDTEIKQKVREYINVFQESRKEAIARGRVDGFTGYGLNDSPKISEYEKQKQLLESYASISEFIARKVHRGEFEDFVNEVKNAWK